MRRRVSAVCAALALSTMTLVAVPVRGGSSGPTAADMFAGCTPAAASVQVIVGRVTCQLMSSALLGGDTAFSYWVPPDCAPALQRRCPVIYLLHGFGGDATEMVGTAALPSAWVSALTSGPKLDPHSVADPWDEADPAGWVARPALDAILVAADGRTVPGGDGPAPGLDGFWMDWNPRYGQGGDAPRYPTPPPRFESSLLDELIPLIEADFPAGQGREWRSLAGVSLGGFGAYLIGLRHPDTFSSVVSVSGAFNFLFTPGIDPGPAAPVGAQAPAPLPYQQLSGPVSVIPAGAFPGPAEDVAAATLAIGDPTVDQAWFRGHLPRDLAMNARAGRGDSRSLLIRHFSNDTVPRRTADVTDGSGYITAQSFEDIVLPMNLEMNRALDDEGVAYSYELHPGLHSDVYRNEWYRGLLEYQVAHLDNATGSGAPPPPQPQAFDFRSTDTDFSAWGWHLHVQRQPVEFLTLRNVSCDGLTLQGSGVVTVTVPARCGIGSPAARTVDVDLGPSAPADEPAGVSGTGAYGRTVTITLR